MRYVNAGKQCGHPMVEITQIRPEEQELLLDLHMPGEILVSRQLVEEIEDYNRLQEDQAGIEWALTVIRGNMTKESDWDQHLYHDVQCELEEEMEIGAIRAGLYGDPAEIEALWWADREAYLAEKEEMEEFEISEDD